MPHPIAEAVPDLEVLLGLEPEELGAKLLFILRDWPERCGGSNGKLQPENLILSLSDQFSGQGAIYGGLRLQEVELAVREAWGYLRSQNLVVDAGSNDWAVLSRRALSMRGEVDLHRHRATQLLPKDVLHSAIRADVWLDFWRGDYDTAVFKAMKAVEVALRRATNPPHSDTAVQAARKAFAPGREAKDGKDAVSPGPLTDLDVEGGERQAMGDLFAGALGALKNPHSHRDVDLADPAEAASVIMLASYLLRVIDARVHRLPAAVGYVAS